MADRRLSFSRMLAAFALLGCGEADPGLELATGAPRLFPIPGCEQQSYALCDITDSACQQSHLALVACVRGSEPGELPPISTLTPEQYAAQLNQAVLEDPPPDPNHWERALSGLGLVEVGAFSPTVAIAREVENVAGYYRFEEGDVVIVDRGDGMDTLSRNLTLMHEFLHVLQGRDVDLAAFSEAHSTSFDSSLAARSIMEGEAELHETRLAAALFGLDPKTVDLEQHLRYGVQLSDEWMFAEPSPYSAAFYSFPYAYGARYVHHAWETAGLAGVLELYAAPPPSTLALMSSTESIVSPGPALEIAAREAPVELTPVHETSLGALGIYLTLQGGTLANDTARAWAGDRLAVYADIAQNTVVVWEVECTNVEAATSVEARFYGIVSPSRLVTRTGTNVVLAFSNGIGVNLSWAVGP